MSYNNAKKIYITFTKKIKSVSISYSWTIAPYEICPEDYAVSMLWRRTPSGELAFNRCPPNATGKKSHNSQGLKSTQPNTKTQRKNRMASQMLSKERKRAQLMFFCAAFLLQCIYFNDVEIIHKFRRLRWQMFLTSMFSTAATAFKWLMPCVPRDFCHLHTIEPSSVLSTSLWGRFLKRKGRKYKKRGKPFPHLWHII